MSQYLPKEIEPEILEFWSNNKVYQKLKDRNRNGKVFYYLDGPPYTTGRIHIGHAWGKALRDSIMRFKRMNGFQVWDQPGFDMHGLPIEVSVEKELGIKDKKEITEKLGLRTFITECEKYALANLYPMIEDFKRLGVWMDWEKPYMTIKNSYIEGAWWALSQAKKKGLLVLGKKSMTWCPRCATALAKHELEYESLTEDSVFVKFPLTGKNNEFLIVWTTTPWTLPFNLAVMAHPDFDYVKAKVGNEIWILAKTLAKKAIDAAGKTFTIEKEFKGSELKGLKYSHPFLDEVSHQQKFLKELKNAHSVVLSDKYVELSSGSGLVHCAPGCGPEDFEVGKANGLPPFNEINEHGVFSQLMGSFAGLRAKKDDQKFVEFLQNKGLVVALSKITHDYAGCWRCRTPVVFRATDQWFLAVEQLRNKMISENKNVYWTPDWAGAKWFNSWLENLQDWCISRQRFWGIPLPIWKCACGNYEVISSKDELKKHWNKEIPSLHRPWIDEVTIPCKCGKTMKRVEDVLDVWLDSGAAPWSTLEYPSNQELFKKLGTPDLILEGKDQIRGWFNSLMCLGLIGFDKVPFKAVYMHGFINDALGRKMSKSLKNIISPYEVVDEFGADALRYYFIGGAAPGLDLNYNKSDAKMKFKNLVILWNLHNFVLDLARVVGHSPVKMPAERESFFSVEESYIFSRLHSTIKTVTEKFEKYELNEIPAVIESFFLDLSRVYVQLVRDKSSGGDSEEKEVVLYTVYSCLLELLKLFAPIAPFVTEKVFQEFRKEFGLKEESVHLFLWPKADSSKINKSLEENMDTVNGILQSVFSAREKAKLGVRWPVKKVEIVTLDEGTLNAVEELNDVIKSQGNVKEVHAHSVFPEVREKVKANVASLEISFGPEMPKIIAKLSSESPQNVWQHLQREGKFVCKVGSKEFSLLPEHVSIEREVPGHLVDVPFSKGIIYLDTTRSAELENEGIARELMRRVQALRKKAGLEKVHRISLYLQVNSERKQGLDLFADKFRDRCGASFVKIDSIPPVRKHQVVSEEEIKNEKILVCFDKVE